MSKEDERIRFTFRLPGELYNRLKSESDKMGVSINALTLKILWEWAEVYNKKPS